jgi:hypothetical protein
MSVSDDDKKLPFIDYESTYKCKSDDLKVGDWVSGTSYYKIIKREVHSCDVVDSFGRSVNVGNSVLQNEMISASQFDVEQKVLRSEMIQKLMNSGNCVFTVKFKKQLTGKQIQEILDEDEYEKQPATKKLKTCNKILKDGGEDRTLVGYLLNTEHEMGRSNVVDLEITTGSRERQIDHRTVYELILRRVRYILK